MSETYTVNFDAMSDRAEKAARIQVLEAEVARLTAQRDRLRKHILMRRNPKKYAAAMEKESSFLQPGDLAD